MKSNSSARFIIRKLFELNKGVQSLLHNFLNVSCNEEFISNNVKQFASIFNETILLNGDLVSIHTCLALETFHKYSAKANFIRKLSNKAIAVMLKTKEGF